MKKIILLAVLSISVSRLFAQCSDCEKGEESYKFVKADYDLKTGKLQITSSAEFFKMCAVYTKDLRLIGHQPYFTLKGKYNCLELKFMRIGECVSENNKDDNYIINYPGKKTSIYWLNWQDSETSKILQLIEFDAVTFKELSRSTYLQVSK